MDINIVNIKTVSVYVLSNTQAISEVQFMKKLSNTEAELKKALLIKKTCNGNPKQDLLKDLIILFTRSKYIH